MTDDIVKYLRLSQTRFNRHAEAADEIERLRKLAEALYEETKRCGSKHDSVATMNWEEYEGDLS